MKKFEWLIEVKQYQKNPALSMATNFDKNESEK